MMRNHDEQSVENGEKISVMFFCLGNICRSPIAEGVFRAKVLAQGLEEGFHIESAGTSGYHVGEAPDPGSQKVVFERAGIDISNQKSQQLTPQHIETFHYVVAMDQSNLINAQRLGNGNIFPLRDFDPQGEGDIPDPWGEGGAMFGVVYEMVDRSVEILLDNILGDSSLGF